MTALKIIQGVSEAKIRNAIWYLKKGKTKKFVCEYLNIAYNTKKLDSTINEFNQWVIKDAEIRKKARYKVFSNSEKQAIAKEYLSGATLTSIANDYYISSARVKKLLIDAEVPLRGRGKNPATTDHIIQDLGTKLAKNEKVFIANLNCFAIIDEVFDETYLDYLEKGRQEKIEIYPFKKGKFTEPVEHIHYEVYWRLPDGDTIKVSAMHALRNKILKHIEETGREFYRVWRDDDYKCYLYQTREELYPIKVS